MAATPTMRLPGQQLVLAGGGFMRARLLLAPVGAPLPPGVHAVVAVPAAAVVAPGAIGALLARAAVARASVGAARVHGMPVAPGGSGKRGVHLLPLASVPAPGPGDPAADDWNPEYEWEGASAFYEFIDAQALDAGRVLAETLLPAVKADAQVAVKVKAVQTALNKAVALAGQGHPNKMDLALLVIRGSYDMVKLAHDAYPSDGLPPLPGEQAFISVCLGRLSDEDHSPLVILGQVVAPLLAPLLGSKLLGPEMPDGDTDLVRSVFVAVAVSQAAATAARDNYISGV